MSEKAEQLKSEAEGALEVKCGVRAKGTGDEPAVHVQWHMGCDAESRVADAQGARLITGSLIAVLVVGFVLVLCSALLDPQGADVASEAIARVCDLATVR